MFGIDKNIFKTFIYVIIGFVFFIALFFPLTQILPTGFHDFIPKFLINDSLLIYIQDHLDFFLGILITVVILTLAINIWSKK